MTNDNRVLTRKRFEQEKGLHSNAPKNRHERRMLGEAAKRHAKLLEATRMRAAGCGVQGAAGRMHGAAEEETRKGALREEVERGEAPAGFVKRGGLFVPIAVALELAVAIACGGIAFDEQDVDAEQDADVAADVEQDADVSEDDGAAEDVSPAEDVETPDEGTTEDVAPEEDGGVEDVEDVPDVVDTPDVEEVPDVVDVPEAEASDGEEAEDSGTEADAPECTRSVTIEPGTPTTGPETVCGSSQVVTPMNEVTRLEGSPECEAVAPVRRVVGKRVMLSPYLDVTTLACARGAMTNALNGQELIVDLTPTNLNTAVTLVPCRNLGIMGVLDGGPGEYDATLQDVRAYLVLNVTPPSGSSRFINAYNTGVAELWTHDRAYVAAVINETTLHGTLCYVYFPITTRTGTYSEVWTAGDYGTFTHNLLVVGPQLQGWEWVRP